MDARQLKQELRQRLKSARASAEYDENHAGALMQHLAELCLVTGANRIACYVAHAGEPDTELFVDWAIEQGIEVLIPRSRTDGGLDWVIFTGELEHGIFGFLEPSGPAVALEAVDLMFIPALAIDRAGNRLGKGKGFYDRVLETLVPTPPLIAVVFEHEVLDNIPTEVHDLPVDAVVTPAEVLRFNERLS